MRDRIYITQSDYDRLLTIIEARRQSGVDTASLAELEQELDRAEVLADGAKIPADVITMNSEVRLKDLDSGEIKEYKLVFPTQTRSENALSILAPIGTAILGYRTGKVIKWRVPKGIRRLQVMEVISQPEAMAAKQAPAA